LVRRIGASEWATMNLRKLIPGALLAALLGCQIGGAAAQGLTFEGGIRYWYSSGSINFGFFNNNAAFGDPTSTLDWTHLTSHSGELFGRVTHDSGLYLKGTIGGGNIGSGKIIDRDFFAGQLKFSDTFSQVREDRVRYGSLDVGWGTIYARRGDRIGTFIGFQYWREKAIAYGLVCNPDDVGGFFCGPPGTLVVPFSTASLGYEPTAYGIRIGVDARYEFAPGFSLSGEAAWLPFVRLQNLDSHFLRVDLAPSPNIISTARGAMGFSAEAFLNYAVTASIEIGAGVRYWGVFASRGDVNFLLAGGGIAGPFPLRTLDMQRYGVLLQLKGQM
jgi:hypothetical protein